MSNIVAHDGTDNNIAPVSPTVVAILKNRNFRPNFSPRLFYTQFPLIKSAFCPSEQFLSILKKRQEVAKHHTKKRKSSKIIINILEDENVSPLDLEIADFAAPVPQIFPIVNPTPQSTIYNQPAILKTDNETLQPSQPAPASISTPPAPAVDLPAPTPIDITPATPLISQSQPIDTSPSTPAPIITEVAPPPAPEEITPPVDASPVPTASSASVTVEKLTDTSNIFQATSSKPSKSAFSRHFGVALTLSLTAAIAFFGFWELTANITTISAKEPATTPLTTTFASSSAAAPEETSDYYQPGLAPTPRSTAPTTSIDHAAALALSQFQNLETSFDPSLSDKLSLHHSFIASSAIPVPNISQLRAQSSVFNSNALKPLSPPPATFSLKEQNTATANDLALSAGTYQYAVTFVTFDGTTQRETIPSETISLSLTTPNSAINLTQIPVYSKSNVVSRRIYRTRADSTELFLVTELKDNTTTTYLDATPDINLNVAAPTTNNTASYQYRVSFFTSLAETAPSEPITFTPTLEQGEASLLNIPLDPSNQARGRRIYRTLAGGADFYLVGQLNNNSSTILADSVSDLVLATRERLNVK